MNENVTDEQGMASMWSDTLVVIVLYNIKLVDSLTFYSLKKAIANLTSSKSIDLLICDNSLLPQNNSDLEHNEGLINLMYLHDPRNPGVSMSYNRAAELANVHEKKWLLVLDQDTLLPKDIFFRYQQAVTYFPNFPIYAPQIYYNNTLYSPCRYILNKGSNFSNIKAGVHSMKYKNVLNSGLLIQLNAFRKAGGYDDSVELYFSDFVFFDRLKKYFKDFIVIDCRLEHQLSSIDYSSLETALTRFIYYCKGARNASRNNIFAYINQLIVVGMRSFLLCYRFNSFKFLVKFVRIFFNF